MSSDKERMMALLLMEVARSGVRDPNLRDVVTDYFTHDSETASDPGETGILEVKCPYSARNVAVADAVETDMQ